MSLTFVPIPGSVNPRKNLETVTKWMVSEGCRIEREGELAVVVKNRTTTNPDILAWLKRLGYSLRVDAEFERARQVFLEEYERIRSRYEM